MEVEAVAKDGRAAVGDGGVTAEVSIAAGGSPNAVAVGLLTRLVEPRLGLSGVTIGMPTPVDGAPENDAEDGRPPLIRHFSGLPKKLLLRCLNPSFT